VDRTDTPISLTSPTSLRNEAFFEDDGDDDEDDDDDDDDEEEEEEEDDDDDDDDDGSLKPNNLERNTRHMLIRGGGRDFVSKSVTNGMSFRTQSHWHTCICRKICCLYIDCTQRMCDVKLKQQSPH